MGGGLGAVGMIPQPESCSAKAPTFSPRFQGSHTVRSQQSETQVPRAQRHGSGDRTNCPLDIMPEAYVGSQVHFSTQTYNRSWIRRGRQTHGAEPAPSRGTRLSLLITWKEEVGRAREKGCHWKLWPIRYLEGQAAAGTCGTVPSPGILCSLPRDTHGCSLYPGISWRGCCQLGGYGSGLC